MDKAALTDALSAIAGAANDALAALADDTAEAVDVATVELPDYHAQDLERIEAEAAATVAVIEAQADADVARIEAAASAMPDPESPEPIETIDDKLVDEPIAESPVVDVEPIETPADVADVGEQLDAADAMLDALPVVEPEQIIDDVMPTPQHWYKRRIRLFGD